MSAGEAQLDPRTPVVVAVGQVNQRNDDATAALEPTALLAEAARIARTDAGSERLLDELHTIAIVHILSHHYADPAGSLAGWLGVSPTRTIHAHDGGNFPQTLLNRACREIQAGASGAWLIGGAETWRTRTAARKHAVDLGWSVEPAGTEPTEKMDNVEPLAHPGEWARSVFLPIEIYPLFENAFRAARGWTIDEHRDRLGRLYAGFSEVAATNPNAWIQRTYTPEEVRTAKPENRMVGFPYTKVMNANNAVDQAACFVVTSVEHARSLGISSDRWVFPWVGTDAHEPWFISNRWSLGEAPALRIAGTRALAMAGLGVDDLDHIDVYSCFPSAVHVAAHELGLDIDRPLTVTGGLSFAGGPWNNYVSHSIAAMVDRLRSDEGSVGMVTGNGGFLTKHSFGIYSTTPPAAPYHHENLQDEVDELPDRELAEVFDAPVSVETAVVMHDRNSQPERVIVSGLLADGRRGWGNSHDPDHLERFLTTETSGAAGHIDDQGVFTFT